MTAPDPDAIARNGLDAHALRRWHLGALDAEPLPADALPLLLAPFRNPSHVRHDYPLVLEETDECVSTRPLAEALAEWSESARSQPRIVRDNLVRLERRVRLMLRDGPPVDARAVLEKAGEQMVAEMQLRSEIADGVRADIDAMSQSAPEAVLLPLHSRSALYLLLAAARVRVRRARERHRKHVEDLADGLRQMLEVEAQKDPEANRDEAIAHSLGEGASRFLDPGALARSVGPHRGTIRTPPERRERLEKALRTLEGWLAAEPMPELVLTHCDAAPDIEHVALQKSDDVCAGAVARFDHDAAAILPVVRAAYLADLEQRGVYEADRHEPLLAAMDWRDLSIDALHALPAIVALAPAHRLAGHEMQSLTGLLTSGRPVHVLVHEAPGHDPSHSEGGHGDPLPTRSRFELGYLGIAFREAFVQQATAARPAHLVRGFCKAIGSARPGLHIVDSGLDVNGEESPLGAFLHASAAIESRAHPLFQYDPEAGETWARRLDFTFNPSPEDDWPVTTTKVAGETRKIHFTFADYAVLDPCLRGSFTIVDDGIADDELIDVDSYLALDEEEARHRVPFVWVVGEDEKPRRAAIRRTLAGACRDRQRYWRTLQELAGVRNEYVREAVHKARQDAAEQAERERAELQARHDAELDEVRNEAADQAMQGLARMLLELDPMTETPSRPSTVPEAPIPTTPQAPKTGEPRPEAEVEAAPEPEPVEEDDDDLGEPWIETPRCSTCNDCVNLNSLLFVYDENKQATIGDPTAGTFAQLVEAAEKCPSRCIHPGKPLNPDEPGLDELVARAALYN